MKQEIRQQELLKMCHTYWFYGIADYKTAVADLHFKEVLIFHATVTIS